MKEKKEKKPGGWKRVLLITVCVILALILIIIACVGAYVNYLLGKIPRVDLANESTISSSEVEELLSTDPDVSPVDPSESLPSLEDVTFPTEITEPVEKEDHVINILLVGQDTNSSKIRARSDSMILVTFNTKAKTVTLTSFMRDSYVQIPGYAPHKLNHAYQYGGFSLLNETLKVNFGVEVDGNVEVNFAQFQKLIDLLGGVDISLSDDEVGYINHCFQSNFVAGVNKLNGEQALLYARLREIDNDYRRTERQRKVLLSLAQAYKNQPIDQMLALLEEVMGLITTDMDNSEIIGLVWEVFPMLSSAEYNTQQIPAAGTFDQGDVQVRAGLKNWFQYNIDFEANREILQEIFEEE